MFPSQATGMGMRTLQEVRQHYNLPDVAWRGFIEQAGDPMDDLKLLGSLPPSVVAAALSQARLHDGTPLTAVQASHVGLVSA